MSGLRKRHLPVVTAAIISLAFITVAVAATIPIQSQELTTFDSTSPAKFVFPSAVGEGSAINLSFTNPQDPADEYSFDCGTGAGFTPFSSTTSHSCATTDDGSRSVAGRVRDGGNAITSYSGMVTIQNVAPSVISPGNQTATTGVAKEFNLGSFSDPGVDDNPWTVAVRWTADGSFEDLPDTNTQGSLGTASHTYVAAGTYTVAVRVTDKDGGAGTADFQVTVAPAGMVYYLHNFPTPPTGNTVAQANLPMDASAPTAATLFNYATNYDSNAGTTGRFMDKTIENPTGPPETDLQKHQTWRFPGTGTSSAITAIDGNVQLKIWAKMKASGKSIQLRAFLRDCNSLGACTNFATLDMAAVSNASSAAFVEYTLSGNVTGKTFGTNRVLQVYLVARGIGNSDSQYLAYDTTAFPARLILP